jgi:inosose dehydratase
MSRSDAFTRRSLLAGATAAFTGATILPAQSRNNTGYNPLLLTQTYIWVQHYSKQKKRLADEAKEAFAAIRRAGYRRVELLDDMFRPDSADRTISLLREFDFELPIVYTGKNFHEEPAARRSLAEVLSLASAIQKAGAQWVNLNPSPKPQKALKTAQELDLQARNINQLGRQLHGMGMKLQLHHHDPEMLENAREWHHILKNTDAKYVHFCLDTDWIVRGKQDPLTLLKEAGTRLASLHLRSSQNGAWMEALGDGEPDYRSIAAHLKKTGYRGYLVVELAWEGNTTVTRSVEENLLESRRYAEQVFEVKASS